MKRYSDVLTLFLILTVFGCSSNKKDEHIVTEPLSNLLNSAKNLNGKGEDTFSSTEVLIKKELLDKDLMLGGVITDMNVIPENEQGDVIFDHFSPKLVRLYYSENRNEVIVETSPRKPWGLESNHRFQKEIVSLSVKEKRADGSFIINLSDFSQTFYLAYKNVAYTPQSKAEKTSYVTSTSRVIIDEDSISFPVEISYAVEKASATCVLRMYLKAWTPKPDFEQRRVKKDYGFFTVLSQYDEYVEYPEIEKRTPEDLILRWDFKNLKSPIEYVISKDVPEAYQNAIQQGVKAWNEPLKKLLNRTEDVIVARFETEDEKIIPGNLKTNYIFWETSLKKGSSGMHASWQADPISGEIFHADVYVGGATLVDALLKSYDRYYDSGEKENRFSLRLGETPFKHICAYSPQGRNSKGVLDTVLSKEEYAKAWMTEGIIHELGHNFGLRHNFKGSLSTDIAKQIKSHSVMDYTSDDVTVAGQALTEPGPYDLKALEWAEFGSAADDRPSTTINPFPFCTDEQTETENSYFDPTCRRNDFGPDPLAQDIIPNTQLISQKLFEQENLFEFFKFRKRLLLNLKDATDFLVYASSVDARLKVNDLFSEIIQNIK
ncbi:MAG: zinc-dependent metalloprotease, partial [Deltaproteobacteria bacterium]|nr:zinc-dependent metalloprotease [Deltaproteobacteria bacterium]